MRDTGFNDKVRLDLPNQFLNCDDVLWVLNNGASEPGVIVGIFGRDTGFQEAGGVLRQDRIGVAADPVAAFIEKLLHRVHVRHIGVQSCSATFSRLLADRYISSSFERSPQKAIGS